MRRGGPAGAESAHARANRGSWDRNCNIWYETAQICGIECPKLDTECPKLVSFRTKGSQLRSQPLQSAWLLHDTPCNVPRSPSDEDFPIGREPRLKDPPRLKDGAPALKALLKLGTQTLVQLRFEVHHATGAPLLLVSTRARAPGSGFWGSFPAV